MKAKVPHGNFETGASLIEYAILVSLVAVVCLIAVRVLGRKASNKFSDIGNQNW